MNLKTKKKNVGKMSDNKMFNIDGIENNLVTYSFLKWNMFHFINLLLGNKLALLDSFPLKKYLINAQ